MATKRKSTSADGNENGEKVKKKVMRLSQTTDSLKDLNKFFENINGLLHNEVVRTLPLIFMNVINLRQSASLKNEAEPGIQEENKQQKFSLSL